jgi:probable rRNA maturation factor
MPICIQFTFTPFAEAFLAIMIANRQRRIPVRRGKLEDFVGRARRALKLRADSFSICFVTDAEMARWNSAYRGKNRPTDVLSFPTGEIPGRRKQRKPKSPPGTYLGDIAIAPAVALRNSRKFGRTLDNELRILMLHGMLHLMGYDHETDAGQMDRREQRLRRALGLA